MLRRPRLLLVLAALVSVLVVPAHAVFSQSQAEHLASLLWGKPHTSAASAVVRTSSGALTVIDLDTSSKSALQASLDGMDVLAADWSRPTFLDPLALSSTPSDPYFSSQWELPRMGIPAAWPTAGGSGVTIAVIDSGVTASSDLPSVLSGRNYVLDGSHPTISDTSDGNGHGTAVSHIAAAAQDASGMVGAAPEASILPVRVLGNTGSGSSSDLASGIIYAADHGAKVINLSVGVAGTDATISAALSYAASKDVLMVAAAGNSGPAATPPTPAVDDNTIAVAATDNTDSPASFSQMGSYIDLAAPGVDIVGRSNDGNFYLWSGTSMSSPLVAGLAALLFSAYPSATASQVRQALVSSAADVFDPGTDTRTGAGIPQATAALSALNLLVNPPASTTTTTTTTTTPSTSTTTTTTPPPSTTTTTQPPAPTTTTSPLPPLTSPTTTSLPPPAEITEPVSDLRTYVSASDVRVVWNPSPTIDATYTLSRDGEVIYTGSGSSFTDSYRALVPGAYLYAVTSQAPSSLSSQTISTSFLVKSVSRPTLLSVSATRSSVRVRVTLPKNLPAGSTLALYVGPRTSSKLTLRASKKPASSVTFSLPASSRLSRGTYRFVVQVVTPSGASLPSKYKTVSVK